MKRRIALCALLSVFVAAGGFLVMQNSRTAAFTFNQNHIIDDQVFDNKGTMSATQIDTFLNQFPSSCISLNNHFSARDPTGYSPTNGFRYGNYVSAGQVIYDAAQAYGLNPQVLLATLQKEESLVDGSAGCSVLRYASAVGYGCPDGGTSYNYSGVDLYAINGTTVNSVNGTCVNTSSKVGFTQQLIRAAWLFKFGEQRSEGNVNWNVQMTGSPQPGDSWDNSDDPQSCYSGPMTQGTWSRGPSQCGATATYDGYFTIDSTAVHMDTGSTAALYWYTPHFSGNQNFYSIFTNWFGDTSVAGYSWSTTGYAITSLDGSVKYDPGQLVPGQVYLATVDATNIGSATWLNNGPHPVTLGSTLSSSIFCRNTWVACNRPAYLEESSIAPGQTGHFVFQFQAPYRPGSYREAFKPVAEELTWFNDTNWDALGIVVRSPGTYTWTTTGYLIQDQAKTTKIDPGKLQPGQTYDVTLDATNTGTATWYNNGPEPIHLGASSPTSRMSSLCNNMWLSCNRPATLTEASVSPGQTGHFVFQFQAPYQPGSYREAFKPVAEELTWFNDTDGNVLGTWVVSPGTYTWATTGYAVYDQTGTTKLDPGQLQVNQTYMATLDATNTGTATWYNGGPVVIHLGASSPTSRMSNFCVDTWIACNRPTTLTEASVAPGQTGHFTFLFKTGAAPGSYREAFKPVAEELAWFNDTDGNILGIITH